MSLILLWLGDIFSVLSSCQWMFGRDFISKKSPALTFGVSVGFRFSCTTPDVNACLVNGGQDGRLAFRELRPPPLGEQLAAEIGFPSATAGGQNRLGHLAPWHRRIRGGDGRPENVRPGQPGLANKRVRHPRGRGALASVIAGKHATNGGKPLHREHAAHRRPSMLWMAPELACLRPPFWDIRDLFSHPCFEQTQDPEAPPPSGSFSFLDMASRSPPWVYKPPESPS
jgi:hypothetical protein